MPIYYSFEPRLKVLGDEVPGALKLFKNYHESFEKLFIQYAFWPNSIIEIKERDLIYLTRSIPKARRTSAYQLACQLHTKNLIYAMDRRVPLPDFNVFQLLTITLRKTREYIRDMGGYFVWKDIPKTQQKYIVNNFPEVFKNYNINPKIDYINPDYVIELDENKRLFFI